MQGQLQLADSLDMEKGIDYEALELNRKAEIQDNLTQKLEAKKDHIKVDSLRHAILEFVVSGAYPEAKSNLNSFREANRIYPRFIERTERYHVHATDLISAIDTKRNFPGLATLPLSKQQELNERVLNHFEELKQVLRRIEVIHKESKLEDVRSTVWTVKSLFNACFFLTIFGFLYELSTGLGQSFNIVLNSLVEDLTIYLNQFF